MKFVSNDKSLLTKIMILSRTRFTIKTCLNASKNFTSIFTILNESTNYMRIKNDFETTTGGIMQGYNLSYRKIGPQIVVKIGATS